MSVKSRHIIKEWFKRGKYPLESQFADWIDSFVHKDDKLLVSQIDGLAAALNGKYDAKTGSSLERSFKKLNSDFLEHRRLMEAEIGRMSRLYDFYHVIECDNEADFNLDEIIEPGYYVLVVYHDGRIYWHRILIVDGDDHDDTASISERRHYTQTLFTPIGVLFRQGNYGYDETIDGDHEYSLSWSEWVNLSSVFENLNSISERLDTLEKAGPSLGFYHSYLPEGNTTALEPGVYVGSSGMVIGSESFDLMAVSYSDGAISRPQGGQYRQTWKRTYHCWRLSSGGFEQRSGVADMGLPSDEDFHISWDGWQPVGSGTGSAAESYTDEEIEEIAMSVGGYVLPAEVIGPMTDDDIDQAATDAPDENYGITQSDQ